MGGVVGLMLVMVIGGACATGDPPTDEEANVAVDPDSEFRDGDSASSQAADQAVSGLAGFDFGTVYFDFDKITIGSDARMILESAGAALRSSGASIVLEGHCDDVGSDEYNLALGELRAEAVRRYLYNLGASGEMSVVSYGEAKPALQGTGESVWRFNRRVEIKSRH